MLDLDSQMRRLASAINQDLTDLCDLAEVSSQKRRVVLGSFKKIPITNLLKLADNLELDFDRLVRGEIDYEAFRRHFQGDRSYLPRRYQAHRKSKAATIANLLTCASQTLSEVHLTMIKRKLQLTDEILLDPKKEVGGLLLMDLFAEVGRFVKDPNFFRGVGRSLCRGHSAEALARLSASEATRKVFEAFIENIHANVEYNMEYRILKSDSTSIIISAATRQEAKDNLKTLTFANTQHYENIMGYYGQIYELIFKSRSGIVRRGSYPGTRAELIFEMKYLF